MFCYRPSCTALILEIRARVTTSHSARGPQCVGFPGIGLWWRATRGRTGVSYPEDRRLPGATSRWILPLSRGGVALCRFGLLNSEACAPVSSRFSEPLVLHTFRVVVGCAVRLRGDDPPPRKKEPQAALDPRQLTWSKPGVQFDLFKGSQPLYAGAWRARREKRELNAAGDDAPCKYTKLDLQPVIL